MQRSLEAHRWLLRAMLFWLVLATGAAQAVEIEFTPNPVRREILALFDGRHEKNASQTRIHKFAEMPLNHLGYVLRYVDVNGPLPEPTELSRYRGMISWLIEPLARPSDYAEWLDKATETGVRFALFSEIAPPDSDKTRETVNRVLKRLGVQQSGEYVSITHKARFSIVDPAMIGFERQLDKVIPDFAVMVATGGETKLHLAATVPIGEGTITAALVTTGHSGGYVSDEFAMYYDSSTDRLRWTLNPFEFFKKVFGEERFPIPDVTTLSGRRIYFSHIDGDGWNNVSEIEGYREGQVLSSEVIAKEAIEPYPDLPVSVGLIAGDTDVGLGGNPAAAAVARRLFALPQVEVASHTYTHPFDWEFFENYDRNAELEKIDQAHRPSSSLLDKLRVAAMRLAGREPGSDRLNRWVAGSADLPRSYLRYPFNLDQEIRGALTVSEKLAPLGKKPKIMLWSGDTIPFEAAIRATREVGVRNMNGGDTRLDDQYPSVFYVPPISRPVGNERQIYAGNSNENTYTNFWHGPYYGYLSLEKTLLNTEMPRRLKPFNVYYHMYMGEKAAALASLKYFLNLARNAEVIPVAASHYAAIADSFFSTTVEQVGVTAWVVSSRGELQTVRFDDAEGLDVNYDASEGVVGSRRTNGSLYVALDAAVERAIVTLRPRPNGDGATGSSSKEQRPPRAMPLLISSRWELSRREALDCGFEVEAQGFGPGQMLWQASIGAAYIVTAERGGNVLWRGSAQADDAGQLSLQVPAFAIEPLKLRFRCHD